MSKKTNRQQEKSEKVLTPGGLRPKDHVHFVAAGQKLRLSKQGAKVEAQRGLRPAMKASEATNLVLTPGGYRHPALVHRLQPQHVLQLAKDRPRIMDSRTKKVMDVAKVSIAPQEIPALGSGWIAYTHWTNTSGNPITSFRTKWQVPPAPATRGSQTIFLFNGIDPSNPSDGILQPVLQWGPSAAGGGSYWSVSSWYVGGDGHAFHTALVPVNVGDRLVGVMTLTDNSNGLFNYVCEFEGLAATHLPVENLPELVWCNETLEAYSVNQCSDYPNTDHTTFTGIALQTARSAPSVVWTPETNVTDCGQHAQVVSNSATDGVVDIFYRTSKVLRSRYTRSPTR